MNTTHIDRLQSDLNTLRGAIQVELPFNRLDAWVIFSLSLSYLPILYFAAIEGLPKEQIPQLAYTPFALAFIAVCIRSFKFRLPFEERSTLKHVSIKSGGIVLGFLGLFLLGGWGLHSWNEQSGLFLSETAGFSVVFIAIGLFGSLVGIFSRLTRTVLGLGLPFFLLGMMFPYLPRESKLAAAFCTCALSAFLVSVIMHIQLNQQAKTRGED